jgi:hypothetical protein
MSHARFCKDSAHVAQIKEAEARLDAMQGELNKLREENARLRQLVRPSAIFVGADDDAGEFAYEQSGDGWL